MDAQFWIYIIIGVIYFLSRLLKKPEQAPDETPDTRQHPGRDRPIQSSERGREQRQMTFEELLREITEGKQAPPPAPEPVREERRYETFDDHIEEEEGRSLERVDFDDAENARVFQKYQEAKELANERRSLEETLRLEDTIVDFKRFEAFEKKETRNVLEDYIKIIRDPQKLKHAVVMSEILKRKF